MKGRYFSKVSFIVFLFSHFISYGHKEWVHQYIAQESYFFLRNEVGEIEQLRNKLGINYDGQGNNYRGTGEVEGEPWLTNYPIVVGAWREDMEDPVWNYNLINGGDASSSHFWDADQGDNAQTNIYIPDLINTYVHNSWEKAQIYLFNGNQHELIIQHTHLVAEGYGLETAFEFKIIYNSIIDLYQGNYSISGYHLISGWVNFTPQTALESGTFWVNWGKILSYEILGRVAHLLGDMSVPTHAHGITHPCPGPLHRGDYFELYLGSSWYASDCNAIPGSENLPVYNWNHQSARAQGGLINEIFCLPDEDAIHYLFYTLNQLSDFFPSGVNDQIYEGSNSESDNAANASFFSGDADLPQGTNSYLDNFYQNFNQLPPNIINPDQIGDVTVNYAIRATASLFYWFALRVVLTTPIPSGGLYIQNHIIDDINNLESLISEGPSSYVIANNQLTAFNTEEIRSGNHVAYWLNSGDVTITNNVNVIFKAGENINLEPGFSVNSGCNFIAEIVPFPCSIPLRVSNVSDQININNLDQMNVNSLINLSNNDLFNFKTKFFKIIPNPSNGYFQIQLPNFDNFIEEIKVFDVSGRKVSAVWNKNNEDFVQLNLESENNGIYFVEVKTSKEKYTSKLFIQK